MSKKDLLFIIEALIYKIENNDKTMEIKKSLFYKSMINKPKIKPIFDKIRGGEVDGKDRIIK